MKQGKILSDFAPIDTLIDICRERQGRAISYNDMQLMHPFIYKAERAAENLSRFALQHFNSQNEYNKELSRLICKRFNFILPLMNFGKFTSLSTDSVTYLNNRIRGIYNYLFNTVEACQSLADVLPPPSDEEIDDTTEENDILEASGILIDNNGNEENNAKESGDEKKVSANDAGDKSSEEESKQDDIKEVNKEEWDSQYDDVFDSRLNPEKIFKKLEEMDNPRVTDDYPRFFVFFKVLLYLGWIEKSQNKFLKWANCHWKCKWNKEYNFKFGNNIKKELRDTHLSKWSSATLPNSDIGDAYRTLAIDVFSKLTETVNGNKIIDRSSFYNKDAKVRINDGKNLEYPY